MTERSVTHATLVIERTDDAFLDRADNAAGREAGCRELLGATGDGLGRDRAAARAQEKKEKLP